jgi:proteasome accessory factor A
MGTMLERLIGLETEYAALVRSPTDQAVTPSRRAVYRAVCQEIATRMPTARGRYDEDTIFLANGGAFSLESSPIRHHQPGGLIEGATAETTSPARLVECQRAQDRLIAEATANCQLPGAVRVFKNSCDAHGHVYGCQENYSAPVASGPLLIVYWILMGLVLPFAMLYWAVCVSLLGIEVACIVGLRMFTGGRRGGAEPEAGQLGAVATANGSARVVPHSVDADSPVGGEGHAREPNRPLPDRVLAATAVVLRLVSLPTALALGMVARTVAFRRQRKYLTAFLVSRVVLTGAGHVDRQNRYRLSGKALAINAVTGLGCYAGERPIFVFQHWLQQICGRSLLSSRSVGELFRRRQRLQIGLSDSNVSDTAEFLKVGTTALVLDMIEGGAIKHVPRLHRPIDALQRIVADWNLVARVPTTQGELSGLDIQRRYLKACQHYVASAGLPAEHEAHEILRRWEETLDALAAFRSSAVDPRPALGHVDWLTKKWMLDRLEERERPRGPEEPLDEAQRQSRRAQRWAARKKVDIRYHELCEDGYFARLRCATPEVCSVDPAGIDAALRMPPTGSPATRRGQLIREFADGSEQVSVDWSHVVIGSGKTRRVVTLD